MKLMRLAPGVAIWSTGSAMVESGEVRGYEGPRPAFSTL